MENIIVILSNVSLILAIGFIIAGIVKGRKNLKRYYQFSIIGLSALLVGIILMITRDFMFLSQKINILNAVLGVLVIIMLIFNISKFRKIK